MKGRFVFPKQNLLPPPKIFRFADFKVIFYWNSLSFVNISGNCNKVNRLEFPGAFKIDPFWSFIGGAIIWHLTNMSAWKILQNRPLRTGKQTKQLFEDILFYSSFKRESLIVNIWLNHPITYSNYSGSIQLLRFKRIWPFLIDIVYHLHGLQELINYNYNNNGYRITHTHSFNHQPVEDRDWIPNQAPVLVPWNL